MYIHFMARRAAKTTKAFKSGNSIAVRLPASFRVEEGTEMRVREELGRYIIEPVRTEPQERVSLREVIGHCPGMKPVPRPRVALREADWDGKRLERG
jgi:antitoxin VapB